MLALWKESYDKPRQDIKSRNITLPTKVHIVKAMFFPVVMYGTSLVAQLVENPHAMQKTPVQFLGWEDPLEKEMATHSV